jgi:hypothetical protein
VIASFFATLAIVDYYGVAPAPDAFPIKIEEATYGVNCGGIGMPEGLRCALPVRPKAARSSSRH